MSLLANQEDPVTCCLLPEARLTHCASCWKVGQRCHNYLHLILVIQIININIIIMTQPCPMAPLPCFNCSQWVFCSTQCRYVPKLLVPIEQVPKVYPKEQKKGCCPNITEKHMLRTTCWSAAVPTCSTPSAARLSLCLACFIALVSKVFFR